MNYCEFLTFQCTCYAVSMVFRYYCEIDNIMVGKVFHVMAVSHWAVVALSGMAYLHRVVVMEGKRAAYYEDYFAIALMLVKPA